MAQVINVNGGDQQSSGGSGSKKSSRVSMPKLGMKAIAMGLVVVGALGVAIYFWNDARQAREESPEGVAARNEEETTRVLGALDNVLLTESPDQPTVARVEDPEVLRAANADFYKNAQSGDYLVLYPQRAILFREAENRVINVAPIINTADLQVDANTTDDQAGGQDEQQ